ncbi:uncharacterized protein LOC133194295 [Saccostrea echinata]|uniref:uncharacterized protein LOC133194295 n=1 Tax=Saccostrea echinata TaxID=191078 RepID=UPI002A827F8E|nr:uncharacterized protein LOC133194295 [Saccostrea echinata]
MEELSQDSQITQVSESQDLFQGYGAQNDDLGRGQQNDLKEILKELKSLRSEVAELKEMLSSTVQQRPFHMASCSFKEKLHLFLRHLFTKNMWLDLQNEEYQSEVKKCLQRDGRSSDIDALKKVNSFSMLKFTEFRNQFRRSLVQKRKVDLRSLKLAEFCRVVFSPFCRSGEDICSTERRRNALLFRTFLYRQKIFVYTNQNQTQNQTQQESHFWNDFKTYIQEHRSQTEDKWLKMEELDGRRRNKFLNSQDAANSTLIS